MDECNLYIGIIEPSSIVVEGLSNILLKEELHYKIVKFDSLKELYSFKNRYKLKVMIINPSIVLANRNEFNSLKSSMPEILWVGLVYSLFDNQTLSLFDSSIQITNSKKQIIKVLNRLNTDDCACSYGTSSENLSDREQDVLIELVNGLSNKEIADKLNISVHTVISHRKNITQKTSIKSLAGLTIYAITNNIVSIEDLS
jgi:DNA-binding CsgD family transcriptional regulator